MMLSPETVATAQREGLTAEETRRVFDRLRHLAGIPAFPTLPTNEEDIAWLLVQAHRLQMSAETT